jgi:hypothetical protein
MGKKVGTKRKMKGSGQGCSGMAGCPVENTITVTLHLPGEAKTVPYTFSKDIEGFNDDRIFKDDGTIPVGAEDLRAIIAKEYNLEPRRCKLFMITDSSHMVTVGDVISMSVIYDTDLKSYNIKNNDTIILCARSSKEDENIYYKKQLIVLQKNMCLTPPILGLTAAKLLTHIYFGLRGLTSNEARVDIPAQFLKLIKDNYDNPQIACDTSIILDVNDKLFNELDRLGNRLEPEEPLSAVGGKQTKKAKRRTKNRKSKRRAKK